MIYAFDTETTTTEPAEAYLCGVCKVHDPESFWYCDNVEDLINYMAYNGGIYYAHNLKFDYSFLFPLLNENYVLDEIITGREKRVRAIMVKNYDNEIVFTLKDSYALFSSPLKKVLKSWNKNYTEKDKVEFYKTRPSKVSDRFFKYFKVDVLGLSEALQNRLDLGRGKLTTSSDSKEILKEFVNKDFSIGKVKNPFQGWLFPSLELRLDQQLRKWYRGGYCYLNPDFKGVLINKKTYVYDVNSMYPDVMEKEKLPYGQPIPFEGHPKGKYDLFVVKVILNWFEVKDGVMPFVVNGRRTSYQSTEYAVSVDEDAPLIERTLYLTNYELELFLDNYNYGEITYDGGYYFKSRTGVLNSYINEFRELKEKSDGAMREFAKLMLNAPSGKFGENPLGESYMSVLEDGVQRFRAKPDKERRPFYLPMSIFITSCARSRLIKQQIKVGRDFIYCDTDSVHTLGDYSHHFDIHPTKFGCWKLEGVFDRAKYLRTKRYSHEVGNDVTYVCAGLPSEAIARVLGGIEEFNEGVGITVGRMRMKKGGMIMTDTVVSI